MFARVRCLRASSVESFRTDQTLFGMITAYFDDSGTGANDSVVAVAGYVGSVSQWQKFDQEWANLLAQYGVSKCIEQSWKAVAATSSGGLEKRKSHL